MSTIYTEFNPALRVVELKVGERYWVSTIHSVSPTNNAGGMYPWGSRTNKTPIKVVSENDNFYTAEVLPHYASSSGSFAESKSYSITIDKWDLKHGEFRAWIMEEEE